jgi:hypothetical protein
VERFLYIFIFIYFLIFFNNANSSSLLHFYFYFYYKYLQKKVRVASFQPQMLNKPWRQVYNTFTSFKASQVSLSPSSLPLLSRPHSFHSLHVLLLLFLISLSNFLKGLCVECGCHARYSVMFGHFLCEEDRTKAANKYLSIDKLGG